MISPGERKLLLPAAVFALSLRIFWLATHRRELEVFNGKPGDALSLYAYDDRHEGGESQGSISQSDSALKCGFRLSSGIDFPYAGCGIVLTSDASMLLGDFYDLSGYDSLRLRIRSNRSSQARLQLLTHDPNLTRADDPLSKRFFIQSIPLERSFQDVRIPMANFAAPEWWFEHHSMQPDYGLKYMERATNMELSAGLGTLLGIADTIEIKSIVFYGENHAVNQIVLILLLLLGGGVGTRLWYARTRASITMQTQQQVRKEEMLKNYDKLPVQSHRSQDLQKVTDFLHSNYASPELSLEQICHETGINRNRLSELLKNGMGTTFKTYLNELRLTEAARLLAQSDLQVTEVGYKVGFGNVSHFNRLFKEKYNLTPLEYRRAHAV